MQDEHGNDWVRANAAASPSFSSSTRDREVVCMLDPVPGDA